ncbi:MAG: PTS sugar transporter subunit IIA [Calditrichaeota bacterium]|nr:MAG: PTS sugar transporter subunit IIA [Calditrichota bacterium]
MVGCLLITHGQIGRALVEACEQITGEVRNVFTLSCNGLTPEAIYQQITHLIEENDLKDGLFILVGLRGGSCWNAGARVVHEYDNVELISGLNLSILLSFLTKADKYPFHKLGEVMKDDGQRGIFRLTKI